MPDYYDMLQVGYYDEPVLVGLIDCTTRFLFDIWLRRNPPMPDYEMENYT
jgi:hypothetical protein